jgi:4,5-DOPA dioxygenase extradiol
MKRNHPRFTTKWASAWRSYEKKAFSFLVAAMSCNLHAYAWGRHAPEPYDWAISFENRIRELLFAEDHTPLINYENQLGTEADLAVPTPDHYLPLLYVIGTRTPSEPVAFAVEGVDGGSVSMLALQVG